MLEKFAVSQEHNIYLPNQDYILESYFSQSALWKNLSGFGKFGCSFIAFKIAGRFLLNQFWPVECYLVM